MNIKTESRACLNGSVFLRHFRGDAPIGEGPGDGRPGALSGRPKSRFEAFFVQAAFAIFGLLLVADSANNRACADDSSPAQTIDVESAPVAAIAAEIDRLFAASWQAENVTPTTLADDSEYIRRLYLDLAGRIPAVSEVREFLADRSPEKRAHIVDRLLDKPSSVRHFTTIWRNALLPEASSQPQFRGLIPGFDAWLWQHFSGRSSYDRIVREIITTKLNRQDAGALRSTTSPEAFYIVRQLKPENLAAGTARAFLGVRLDCAQCHDHPFDRWKQTEFWGLAAFYAGLAPPGDDEAGQAQMPSVSDRLVTTIKIPGTDDVVPAMFLTGQRPRWKQNSDRTPREVLADWVVSRDNPYFARMAVNRMWGLFFGRGLVDPVDDFSDSNPPSHPEVLDLLARDFASHGYDLQRLVRVLTHTRVYQLSSRQTDASQQDPSLFARAALRGLTAEQFFDSLAEAVGYYQPYRSENPFVVDDSSPRAQYLELFRDASESPLDRQTTILQALAMMNGRFIDEATSLDRSRTLRAVIEFPAMTDEQRLETLFLATLSRRPTATEQQKFARYVASGKTDSDRHQALADVFWVLLNSSEFLLNH